MTPQNFYAYQWGCHFSSIPGADGSLVGSRSQNTVDIVSGCEQSNIVAKKCAEYVREGYDHWFLPSKQELNLIHQNLYKTGLANIPSGFYWSSTERSSAAA